MPQGLVENLAEASVLAVYRAYHDELSYIALQEGVTTGMLLNEEWSDKDAQALADVSKEIQQVLDDLESQFSTAASETPAAAESWKAIVAKLKAQMEPVGPAEIINLKNEDPEALGKKTAELTKIMQGVVGEIAAIIELVAKMQADYKNVSSDVDKAGRGDETIMSLGGEGEQPTEEPTSDNNPEETPQNEYYKLPLANLLFEQDAEKLKFPDWKKQLSAIQKQYQIPASFKDRWAAGSKAAQGEADKEGEKKFFGKAMDFVKGIFGASGTKDTIVSADEIATAIGAMKFNDFLNLSLEKAAAAIEPVTKVAGQETTSANTSSIAVDPNAADQPSGDEPPPPTEEEALESQKAAEAAAKAAATAGVKLNEPPGVAVGKAIEGWKDALPDGTQKWLMAKGGERFNSLKGGIETVFADQAKAVSDAVGSAITQWHTDNADAIKSSKRFSQKGQAQLTDMMQQMVTSLMQKKHESPGRFTYGTVERSVYRYLDNYYFNSDVLMEAKRWNKLAGIGED